MKRLIELSLSALAALAIQQASAQNLNLHTLVPTNYYLQNFDGLSVSNNGAPPSPGTLPGEWSVWTNVTPTSIGTLVSFDPGNMANWTDSAGAFNNYAGFFDYIGQTNFVGTEDGNTQTNEPNRCLGIRQIGVFGDPGAIWMQAHLVPPLGR